MSKQIQVSDTLYQRLKGAADAHYRSIGGEIEFMMDFIGGRNGAREDVSGHGVWTPDNHPANKQPKEAIQRTSQDVLKDIKAMEQEEKESVNQDPDHWAEQAKKKQDLWDEYHALKNTEG